MTSDTTLRLERVIDAPIESVFRAWTMPEAIVGWYRDRPADVVRVLELDVRVGGRYRIEFGPPNQAPYVETGTYVEIDPPKRLVMTETLDAPDGTQWSDTTVTVALEAQNGKTHMTLTHQHFPTVARRDDAGGGWPRFLDRLERFVTT